MRVLLIFVFLFFLLNGAFAQAFEVASLYRTAPAEKQIFLAYENDFLFGTDYGNTQNLHIGVVHPALGKSLPYRMLLLQPKGYSMQHGIAFGQEVYTPKDIGSPEVQKGDYPYAGTLLLQIFTVAKDGSENKNRLYSGITLGMIGPFAMGFEMQDFIHKNIGSQRPQGWKHQVGTDVVLNYNIQYQRLLYQLPGFMYLSGGGAAKIGTLNTSAATSILIMGGLMQHPFFQNGERKFILYAFAQPQLTLVGFDATLQGGLFHKNNDYVVRYADISRIQIRNDLGLVVQYKNLKLTYSQSRITAPFKGSGLKYNAGLTATLMLK